MLKRFEIVEGKITQTDAAQAPVLVYINPSDEERAYLAVDRRIGEHNLVSAMDPDELSRIEFEEDHVAVIFKRPKNYSSEDNFLFKVTSSGFFLFKDQLIVVMMEDLPIFDRKVFDRLSSVQDVFLKILYRFVHHFFEHLKVIQMVTDALEQKINTAMENRYLLNLFTLEKSLVYYLSALQANTGVIEKIRVNSSKFGFLEAETEFLEDLTIENQQCFKMSEIYSNILASMMDARASIVNNNLNMLMKNLTLVMLGFAVSTFVVSTFSMNLPLPFGLGKKFWAFWFVMSIVLSFVIVFIVFLRKKKW
jgi:magnesium transporter